MDERLRYDMPFQAHEAAEVHIRYSHHLTESAEVPAGAKTERQLSSARHPRPTDPGSSPFPPHGRDTFAEWLHVPVAAASPDPRIELRRAQPGDFERIYDLVDEVFGIKRSRALCDWAYRRNPYGMARCWISVERATGKLVGSTVNWPWPLARGMSPLPGAQGGDAVVARAWQRQRLHEHAGRIRESHPWTRSVVNYGWPNAGSVRRVEKMGKAARLLGALRLRVLPLRTQAYLADCGLPRPLAAAGGRVLDTLFATWSRSVLRRPSDGLVERVRRFDGAFEEVTRRCMPWEGYWSPHDAEFLNWRYCSDPVREHVAFSLTVGSVLRGYSVVRVHCGEARLMELVAPHDQPGAARQLLLHAIRTAADAGCSHLAVAAPPTWQHWQLLRSAGFVPFPSKLFMYAYSWRDDTPGVQTFENWQFLGGDLDPFIT